MKPPSPPSDDALWLWRCLDEQGLEALDDEDLGEYIAAGEQPWPASRLEAAIAELEALGIVVRDEDHVSPPAIERGTDAIVNGTLVSVTLKVYSATEIEFLDAGNAESRLIDTLEACMIDSGRPSPPRTRRALYWCSTEDGDEDWFVVASNAALARAFHEDAIGYDTGDARAEWVVDVPDSLTRDGDPECAWPTNHLIHACGGEYLPFHPDMSPEKVALREIMGVTPAVVRIAGRIFIAGDVVENTYQRSREPDPTVDN